jgi:hypothetical protein
MYSLGTNNLTNEILFYFQKDFWKQDLILTFQKFIITIWLKFQKKKKKV